MIAEQGFGAIIRAFSVHADELAEEGFEDAAHGSVTWRTLIAGERDASRGLVAGIATFGPEGTLTPHRHSAPEFYFGMEGAGTVTIDGVPHPIGPGIAVYLPPDSEHGVVAGGEGLRFLYAFPVDRFADVDYRFSHCA